MEARYYINSINLTVSIHYDHLIKSISILTEDTSNLLRFSEANLIFDSRFPDVRHSLDTFHAQKVSSSIIERFEINFDSWSSLKIAVINQLLQVAPGETVTYSELAKRAGSDKAARAVGTVMSKNMFPLLIPCHRVVRKDSIGHFAYKTEIKERLLSVERKAGCNS